MPFKLSGRSLERLEGVNPDLVRIVERAIGLSTVDFGVAAGRRTEAEQRRLVEKGASQTMESRHLTGDAVDLYAWVNGGVSWEEPWYYDIAQAIRQAAVDAGGVHVRWGACWARLDLIADPRSAVDDYVDRCRGEGRRPFLDLGHFELPKVP